MNGLLSHLALSLRLHFRNTLALLYGYCFPLIFLAAFWVLYRHETVPLLRHMGELLTVSVLGGACFGLPTTLVSEREHGVWRRYHLTPVPTWTLVVSTVVARYVMVLSAGLLQVAAALALGMTSPEHPFELWVAFTVVVFAFIGLGLVMAMLANNVPAVQALGQCIFLPMLIIGGVAVPLASLPGWAQRISAFFPGRYAVEALQATVAGPGLTGARFSLLALVLTGVAGMVAGAKLFRWDAQSSFSRTGKLWAWPVFAAWLAIGMLADNDSRIGMKREGDPASVLRPSMRVTSPWENITDRDVAGLNYRVPPDGGVVAPFASSSDLSDEEMDAQIIKLRRQLPTWSPGAQGEVVQRVRNLLYVAAVPDAVQHPAERFLPEVVLERLSELHSKEQLVKILTWIVLHPEEGMVITDVSDLGLEGTADDSTMVRQRAYWYALKFIARLTGRATVSS